MWLINLGSLCLRTKANRLLQPRGFRGSVWSRSLVLPWEFLMVSLNWSHLHWSDYPTWNFTRNCWRRTSAWLVCLSQVGHQEVWSAPSHWHQSLLSLFPSLICFCSSGFTYVLSSCVCFLAFWFSCGWGFPGLEFLMLAPEKDHYKRKK